MPDKIDLFERGISQGETLRLWIDMVAHVVMGRDKRIYRFVQDTRYGRIVIAQSHEMRVIVDAVTDYVGRRMLSASRRWRRESRPNWSRRISHEGGAASLTFVLGLVLGAMTLFALALFASLKSL